jgi:GNAT superfamily N-acetyltransferase
MIEIIPVETKKEKKVFVEFQYELYKDVPQFVPPFKADVYMQLNKEKHPWYEHSESDQWIAQRDGKVVGRIAALENKRFNDFHKTKQGSFYLFDCINDQDVANALFDTAIAWAKARGLNQIVGPKGYGPLDGYGIQIEGNDHRQMMNMMNYNFPYYQTLVETYGFTKEVDFVSSFVKPQEFVMPEKIKKAVGIARKRARLTIKSFKDKKEIRAWKTRIKEAYNGAFVQNWEYYPLTDRELDYVLNNALLVVIPTMVQVILNENGDLVGFVLPFPDISRAMQKNKGKMGPIEIIRLLLELNKTDWVCYNGIAILPEYQGMGGNALLFDTLLAATQNHPRLVNGELSQVAETAVQMRKDLLNLGVKPYKNHRVYKYSIE